MLVKKEFTHKLNLSPRLSASQVAEYLSANATARRRIIIEAKYPPTCLLPRYDEVREALCKHLAKKYPAKDVLGEALDALGRKANAPGATDWAKGNLKIGGEACGGIPRPREDARPRKGRISDSLSRVLKTVNQRCHGIGFSGSDCRGGER